MERQHRSYGDTVPAVAAPLTELVTEALSGDAHAWEALVERLKGVVWRATRDAGLALEDREDVFAATFFRLYENLPKVREPAKLPGWLATTAHNEIASLVKSKRRTEPRSDVDAGPATERPLDEHLLDAELRRAMQEAFSHLEVRLQQLLMLLAAVPPISYDEISAMTGIPRGSLGPTRQRCLERLRRSAELQPFMDRRPS